MNRVIVVGVLLLAAVGCSDNSAQCGFGTTNVAGVCTASTSCGSGTRDDGTGTCVPDGTVICTDGTTFDTTTDQCVLDPSVCQDGTVLVGSMCVDPTTGLVIDLQEGAEPNGLGVHGLETNAVAPAGTIALKAIGSGAFVIHGQIAAFQDNDGDGLVDPDLDAYELTVTGPTLLQVSADGVGGLAAGFQVVARASAPSPLATWSRYGINLTGDTSQRQLYLPAAGTYELGVADVRTLFLDAGATAGTTDYYVSITQLAIPMPTPVTLDANGAAAIAGSLGSGAIAFYAAPMGTGLNDIEVSIVQTSANASAVVLVGGAVRRIVDAVPVTAPDGGSLGSRAQLALGGITAADANATTIVVDYDYDVASTPVDYDLIVHANTAVALPASGSATQAVVGSGVPVGTLAAQATPNLTTWSLQVTAAGQIFNGALTWSALVDGYLVDQDGAIVSAFSYDPQHGFGAGTWVGYVGLLRFPAAGTYYFAVDAPGATTLTATSSLAPVTPVVLPNDGTQITASTASGQVALTFAPGTTPVWESLAPLVGTEQLVLFDATTAFGRLGPSVVSGLLVDQDPPVVGVISQPSSFVLAGAASYIVDAYATGTSVKLSAAPVSAAANLGPVTPPTTIVLASGTTTFAAIPPGSLLSASAAVPFDLEVLAADGSLATSYTTTALTLEQDSTGFSLLEANANLFVSVSAPTAYTIAPGTTAFTDICVSGGGGTAVAFPDADEGVVANLPVPAAFTHFGLPVTSATMSTNGFLSLAGSTASAPNNAALPSASAPGAIVAPYWTNLAGVTGCYALGTMQAVYQWNGHLATDLTRVVQMQAILRTDGSIEFVYGPLQTDFGRDATIGIQDSLGIIASQLAHDANNAITASSSKKWTP